MDEFALSKLVGAWRLTAAYIVVQGTSERADLYGPKPRGYAVFEPNGRLMGLLMSSGRDAAQTDPDRATLFKSMMAYSGKFSIDAEKFVTKVDMAWDPSWEGTEQIRYYTFENDQLSLRTTPIEHPSFPGQKIVAYVDWTRDA
jgi:hypothetical protein